MLNRISIAAAWTQFDVLMVCFFRSSLLLSLDWTLALSHDGSMVQMPNKHNAAAAADAPRVLASVVEAAASFNDRCFK